MNKERLWADRHRGDARNIERKGGYDLYEFESSCLTNVHRHGLVGRTLIAYNRKNSMGLLTFDTTRADPEVTFEIVDIDNDAHGSVKVKRSELSLK